MKENKKIIFGLFIAVVILQLYFPVKMIRDKEDILVHGKEFRFKVAPLDPSDPFRGKYIRLNFSQNEIAVEPSQDWQSGETVYLTLATDTSGYAQVLKALKSPPYDVNYVKAKVNYCGKNDSTLFFEFPFNEFYMNETLAPQAESLYRKTVSNTTGQAYAVVCIKHGDAALKDVRINHISLEDLTRKKN